MDSLHDLLKLKADKFDDEKRDDTSLAQQELERMFPDSVEVQNINDGAIYLRTQSSPIASELRLRQIEILQILNNALKVELTSVRIRIS